MTNTQTFRANIISIFQMKVVIIKKRKIVLLKWYCSPQYTPTITWHVKLFLQEWKVISPYLVIARQRQGIAARPIKLCLRLYEMNKKQCLLDFQNVSSFKDSDLSNKIELEVGVWIVFYKMLIGGL